jgi:hypothetical protein
MKLLWIVGCLYMARLGATDALNESIELWFRVLAGIAALAYTAAAIEAFRQKTPWLMLPGLK